jgi:membrane protein DedA with SNARE-associated domain
LKPILHFLIQHGYAVLAAVVFAEQVGMPLPSVPFLLAMGALAGSGQFSFWLSLALALTAAFLGDWIWYELGKRRGARILKLLCRISLEPDSCVSNTQTAFEKQGARALLIAKFVPGLSTMAPPMAGLTGMSLGDFAAVDGAGAVLWAGCFLGLGFIFSEQLEDVANWAARLGSGLGVIVALAVAVYLGYKYYQRRKFMRSLRIARIAPEDLKRMIDDGEEVTIVDLRNAYQLDGVKLPGALLFRFDEIESRHEEIPRDRDIILYCT